MTEKKLKVETMILWKLKRIVKINKVNNKLIFLNKVMKKMITHKMMMIMNNKLNTMLNKKIVIK